MNKYNFLYIGSIRKIAFFILIFLSIYQYSSAQKKVYTSVDVKSEKPVIDGHLTEMMWDVGEWASGFKQFEPQNGIDASQKTEFKILYDENNIYVAIKAFDSEPDKIEKRMSRRDGWEGDKVAIGFDSYHDLRTCFIFGVSASGVKSDGIASNDQPNPDDTWDPIWYVKTSITPYGWVAEMRIPFSQLRYSNATDQVWGLNIMREVFREQEISFWQHMPDDESGWVSLFGIMNGIRNVSNKRLIEIAPYVMGKADFYEVDEENPFSVGKEYSYEAGIDGKIGITNDFILDFAINPDFGQVEADPSEVNLSAFESYFREKRLFFVEGNNIITFPFTPGDSPWSADNLFYSRRIGRSPQYYPDLKNNEYADIPSNTRILGAVKLTGKTKEGWSVGILESVTNSEYAIIDTEGERTEEIVEPMTNYFLARVQKDINKGNALFGGMVTSTYRNIESENVDFLNRSATTGGIDFTQFFKDRKYSLSANAAVSHIEGSENAILEQQLSSRRYFQRPDADYLELDSSRTSLTGHAGKLSFSKNANSGFRYAVLATWRSPGFETNDMGFVRRSNSVFHYIWAGYSITKPFSIFRSMQINGNEWAGWDFSGTNNFFGGNVNLSFQFNNLWTFNTNISREGENIDNTALRGGPALYLPGNWNFSFNLGSNSTKKLYTNIGFWRSINDSDSGNSFFLWSNIVYRPHKTLEIGVYPNFSINKNQLQYVTQSSYGDDERYIFAEMNQKTTNLVLRINYNITPDLTIQFYGAPFVSGADYSDYKLITDPNAINYFDRYSVFNPGQISYIGNDNQYGISEMGNTNYDYIFDNPDFNFRQYRSNLVLRWEYIPGSVFYLVWSQSTTDYESEGGYKYFRNLNELFSVTPRDILLIKFSYRFLN